MSIDRRVLLKVMLGALALAALSGLAALFLPIEGVWRFAAMAVVGAIAAAVMMSMSKWTEKPETRLGGAIGMGVCLALFLGACVLIWEATIGRQLFELVAVAMVAIALTGFPAAHFVKRIEQPGWRWAALVGGIGAAVVFVIAMCAALIEFAGVGWVRHERLYGVAAALGGATLCVALSLVGWRQRADDGSVLPDRAPWRWVALPGAIVGAGTTIWGIWFSTGNNAWVPVAGYSTAAIVAHAVLVGRSRSGQSYAWLRIATIGAGILTGVIVTSATWMGTGSYDGLWRMTTGAAILAVSGTLALIVIDRLSSWRTVELHKVRESPRPAATDTPLSPPTRPGVPALSQIKVECPRCAASQTIPTGENGALCVGCRLHIAVLVHEAHCARCGYDLSNLKGSVCPECGAGVGGA